MTTISRTGPFVPSLGNFDSQANLQIAYPAASQQPGMMAYCTDAGWVAADGNDWSGVDLEYALILASTYTLTSSTSSQQLFNVPAGGTLALPAAMAYFFECFFSLSSMSATSGNMGFDILGAGSATLTSSAWMAWGLDATTQTTAATIGGSFSATNAATGDIITATTGTAVSAYVKGVFRIANAGTIIPSVKLTTGAAAVVGANSYFRCWPAGIGAVASVGPWA